MESKADKNGYLWQAYHRTTSKGRQVTQQTKWLGSPTEAQSAFFQEFPRSRKCNIVAAKETKCGGQPLMIHGFTDPFIRNVAKHTVLFDFIQRSEHSEQELQQCLA